MSRSLRPRPSTQTQMGADAGKLPMVNVVETGLLREAWRRQPGRLDERDRDRRLADGQIEGIGGVAHVGPEHNRLPGRRVEARRHHRIAQVTGEVGSVT